MTLVDRRTLLRGGAAAGLGATALVAGATASHAARDGHGLRIVARNENGGRLQYYRFATNQIGWNPAVNVLLPDGYHGSGRRYPVLYLFHGGNTDFRQFHGAGIIGWSARKDVIIVMPDGGPGGWYSNAQSNFAGPRNWENFHIRQLLPWVDANFRTFAETRGRAVGGFSMGGFGALKYMAQFPHLFDSVSSHSGPASLRRDAGAVAHWANAVSAALELQGNTVFGAPIWNEAKVTAANAVEQWRRYRGKRIFLAAGTTNRADLPFEAINEILVLRGQREFRSLLSGGGIPFVAREFPDTHRLQANLMIEDLNGIVARLRRA